jgi:hypothetical protein
MSAPSSDDPPPSPDGGARFTEADLAPDGDSGSQRRAVVERIATTAALVATGLWIGGMVALGACAAPAVFALTPAPFSGEAMGTAFARFDKIAVGCSAVVLGAEIVRTFLHRKRRPTLVERLRRTVAIVMAAGAAYVAAVSTPRIMDMHRAGVRRNVGPEGAAMEATHERAEAIGKAQVALGVALVALHVFTLRARRPEDEEDEEDVPAPLPPGPRRA